MNVPLANTRDGKAHLNKSLIIVPMKEPGVVVVKKTFLFLILRMLALGLKLPCVAVLYFNFRLSGACILIVSTQGKGSKRTKRNDSKYNCCAFRPAFGCCVHPKAGLTTFYPLVCSTVPAFSQQMTLPHSGKLPAVTHVLFFILHAK